MEQHEILKIIKKKKDQYIIDVSDYESFVVDQELLVQFDLRKGKILHTLEIEQLVNFKERNKVYNTALRLLGIRPRTAKEIRNKLKEKSFETNWIEWTLTKLKNEGYINHQEYAIQFVEEAIKFKKKGMAWIRFELKNRGVEEEFITSAINQFDGAMELEAVLFLANKKWEQLLKKHEYHIAKYKLQTYLQGRGYAKSLVNEAISTLEKVYNDNN
jgi:regulatory protein